jgi:diguanylate cyclase (GGDEF)-like protein
MGIYQSYIDELVFNRIKTDILEAVYEDHTYMWVNQILNYDGGDDYAIRFIHPNATPQSGTLLSTNTVVNGKMPYLEELEGIKEDGEVYFTYHFTLPGTDELAEKITYAKLYERYDFVIAMGIYIEDINGIIASQQTESYQFSVYISLIFIVIFFLTFGINFFINYKINQSKVRDLSHTLIQESNKDELTSAYLRRVAIKDFEVFHDKILKNKQLVIGFALFDIDYFKQINDTYGHKIGDTILKDLVKLLNHTVINDNIYRWGGDEFILIIESDSEEKVIQTIKEIMHQVTALRFIDEAALSITLSLGLTFISKLDKSIDDTVFRADKALYKAKSSGRNQIKVCEE